METILDETSQPRVNGRLFKCHNDSRALSALIYPFDFGITPLIPRQILNAHNTQIARKKGLRQTYIGKL